MNREEAAAALKQVNFYLNELPARQRRYGFAYIQWLKGGATGLEPPHPRLSAAEAARLKDAIDYLLHNEPLDISTTRID